jgi:hypothetical protein
VRIGTTVVIKDASGATVATTTISSAEASSDSDNDKPSCRFSFSATVPESPTYDVQFGGDPKDHGTLSLADVQAGKAFFLFEGCESTHLEGIRATCD